MARDGLRGRGQARMVQAPRTKMAPEVRCGGGFCDLLLVPVVVWTESRRERVDVAVSDDRRRRLPTVCLEFWNRREPLIWMRSMASARPALSISASEPAVDAVEIGLAGASVTLSAVRLGDSASCAHTRETIRGGAGRSTLLDLARRARVGLASRDGACARSSSCSRSRRSRNVANMPDDNASEEESERP